MSYEEKQAIFDALHFIFHYLLEQSSSTNLNDFVVISREYGNLVSVIGVPQ